MSNSVNGGASRSEVKAGRKVSAAAAGAAGGRDYKSTEFGWKRRNSALWLLRRLVTFVTGPFTRAADGGHRWREWLRRRSDVRPGKHGP